jgi:hypothetical protein
VEAARPSNTNNEEALDKFEYSNGKSSAKCTKGTLFLGMAILPLWDWLRELAKKQAGLPGAADQWRFSES